MFLIPFPFGSGATLKWGEYWRYTMRVHIDSLKRNATEILHRLSHLRVETAARHVLLFTVDVEFVDLRIGPPLLREALVVHLGDDHVPCRAKHQSFTPPLVRSLAVPLRVSQWCPLGFPPPERTRTRLLLANINPSRHATRGILAKLLQDRARALGVEAQLLFPSGIREVAAAAASGGGGGSSKGGGSGSGGSGGSGESGGGGSSSTGISSSSSSTYNSNSTNSNSSNSTNMLGPREAAEAALASTFCLCPTGDSKGFTARFWFSIAHGCIPVRFDGFGRRLRRNETAYPFAHRIDWARIVVEATDVADGKLLDQLLAMPQAEVEARRRYLREVRPMLMYGQYSDWPALRPAASGRGGSGGGGGGGGAAASATAATTTSTSRAAGSGLHQRLDPPHLLIEQLERRFLRHPRRAGRGGDPVAVVE
jgi:uncharacterized membrane protein YgcG